MNQYVGEMAALGAAFLWASSSVIYTHLGRTIPPLLLNLTKGAIAIAFLLLTVVLQQDTFSQLPGRAIAIFVMSGILGIGLGDTFYFQALNYLGPRLTLLLEALAPPLTALIALIFLQESLALKNWLGVFLTISGVAWVVSERIPSTSPSENSQIYLPKNLKRGVIFALLAALCQATGAVLSRSALLDTNISPLWSTIIRLMGGIFILFILLPQQRYPAQTWQVFSSRKTLGIIALTAFGSTYLGIWFQQIAFKYTQAGIAQSLLSVSPLFSLPIVMFLGEKISLRAVLGVILALMGIRLLFN